MRITQSTIPKLITLNAASPPVVSHAARRARRRARYSALRCIRGAWLLAAQLASERPATRPPISHCTSDVRCEEVRCKYVLPAVLHYELQSDSFGAALEETKAVAKKYVSVNG